MTPDERGSGHDPEEIVITPAKVQELEDEVEHLKQAVWSHATADQAVGVLLAVGQMSPAEAWDVLREMSMRTNTKLRTVAEQLIEWGRTGVLAPDLRAELDRQLVLRQGEGEAVSEAPTCE
ncbi:ANTAR domain-containing protein [Streptomyces sp. NPDC059063]|uniref:ANTAR domain-containing protein n=1 Tax=unclassified Streptomyces TaxID=2593676 RepID=UPI0036C6DAB5